MITPEYYQGYTQLAGNGPLLQSLEDQQYAYTRLLGSIPHDKWDHRYAEGKWSIRELVLHVTDTERVFSYRALRIARHDQTPLPGFEQDNYVPASDAMNRSSDSLIDEFKTVRAATISLFKSFSDEIYSLTGVASGGTFDVEGLGKVITGHLEHHVNVLQEKYLDIK
jgi:hypothetical protein